MNTQNQNPNPESQHDDDGPNWKWWHFALAGLLIAGWCLWRWWETKMLKHLSGLVLAALCFLVGLGMRGHKGQA
jgi:hypothetical protein